MLRQKAVLVALARSTRSIDGPRPLGAVPNMSRAESAEFAASSYYEAGYWCGESVVKAVNEVLGHPMPPEAFRMASGFCEGLGGSRCICGALAGGVMASGLASGRTSPDQEWEPSYDAAAELRRRWIDDQEAETCDEVVKRIGGMHLPERWAHCTLLVGRTARWVIEISDEQTARGAECAEAGELGVSTPSGVNTPNR